MNRSTDSTKREWNMELVKRASSVPIKPDMTDSTAGEE